MEKIDNMEKSIAISRQHILADFYETMTASLKKEAAAGGKLTKAKLDKALLNSVKTYGVDVQKED